MRSLASRNQQSTGEIRSIINGLHVSPEQALTYMKSSDEQASSAVADIEATGTALQTITDSVAQINNMHQTIVAAIAAQNTVANNVNDYVDTIISIAESTTAETNELVENSVSLNSLCHEIQNQMNQFKV